MIQKLNDNQVPPTHIMQISGHKNVQSINNYSSLNSRQLQTISTIISTESLWSSISAKTRSLYSILDLLYFMLPYTMRHPTVLTLWLNFSIVHGTFCFSHSISRNWHTKLTIFCFFDKNGQLRNFRLSMLCFQHPSSCIRLRSTSFRNPSREGIASAANLHPYPHGSCRNEPSSSVE